MLGGRLIVGLGATVSFVFTIFDFEVLENNIILGERLYLRAHNCNTPLVPHVYPVPDNLAFSKYWRGDKDPSASKTKSNTTNEVSTTRLLMRFSNTTVKSLI